MIASRLVLIVTLMLSLLAVPLATQAQQPVGKVYRIGILYASTGFDPSADPTERALVDGLRERGYVVGQNLVIELRTHTPGARVREA